MNWRIHSLERTESTNRDARGGRPGDVFTAEWQSAGRGRLDHRWLSPPGVNLLMSAVLPCAGQGPEAVATLPLVAGLAVARAARDLIGKAGGKDALKVAIKWPNDVLVAGRKLAGILCERAGETVIVGIGVNVGEVEFPPEIAARAVSLAQLVPPGRVPGVAGVRDRVLAELDACHRVWAAAGFGALRPEIDSLDCLRGRLVTVRGTDADEAGAKGVANGISLDGSLTVGDRKVYAGEAHVEEIE